MPRAYKKRELSSYPQEFFLAWDEAIADSLYLTFASRGQASNFKHQMYMFRKRHAEEQVDPRKNALMYSIDLEVVEDDEKRGIVRVQKSGWKHQLREKAQSSGPSGPEVVPLPIPYIKEVPNEADAIPDPVESTLSNLGFSTKQE